VINLKEYRCNKCGRKVKVDENYGVQFCECGAYFRKSRDFTNRWVFAGFWKGGKGAKEEMRQAEKQTGKKKKKG